MKGSMLSQEDRSQQRRDADALRAWWAGSKEEPFVLPRRQAYNVCTVLFPTLSSSVRFHLRYVAMTAIAKIPWAGLKVFLYRRMGIKIGRAVYIAPWVFLDPMYPELIELENGCFLGGGSKLLTHEYTSQNFRIGQVRIGSGSVIGAFSIVRSGVSIGCGVTTGLGSVVVKDIPDGKIVSGNPARTLRARETAD
jgi:acetyltransferase-like isoleucine patch superfamily enzyme